MSRILHISKEEIDKQSNQIFTPIKYGESGTGVCYPACKIGYNLSCFLQNKKILKRHLGNLYKRFIFITIDLEKEEDVSSFLEKVQYNLKLQKIELKNKPTLQQICDKVLKKGKEPYFFLLDAHFVAPEKLAKILRLIHSQILKLKRIGCIVFFESNIYQDKIAKILQANNKFLQNILTFPAYSPEESEKFLINLAKAWNIKAPDGLMNTISKQYSGYLWLLREALRQVKYNKKINIEEINQSPGIQLRLQYIYDHLTSNEKQDLANLCFAEQSKVSLIHKNYFEHTGVVKKEKKGYTLTLPTLTSIVKNSLTSSQLVINKKDEILLQGKEISPLFAKQELSALLLLLKQKGHLVSRDNLAKVLWGILWEEKYSDWAIDKVISRIRKILKNLGLTGNIIVTKKGRGFQIN